MDSLPESNPNAVRDKLSKCIGGVVILVCSAVSLWAAANSSLSGTLRDPSCGVVSGAAVTLVNTALKSEFKAISDAGGFYSFPTIPVGHYDLTIEARGFKTEKIVSVLL